jgi:hypothetical protein
MTVDTRSEDMCMCNTNIHETIVLDEKTPSLKHKIQDVTVH